eukprot:4780-Heterococcus_DN1.PRE.1
MFTVGPCAALQKECIKTSLKRLSAHAPPVNGFAQRGSCIHVSAAARESKGSCCEQYIQLFVNAVLQASSCIPAACSKQMRCMLQKWQVLRLDEGVVDSAVIEQTLARLGPSDTFALDVAAQNAALVVTVDADGATAVVKVLQIHPSNNLTTANNGNLSAVYPGAAVRVPIARVRGQALAFQ